MITYIKKTQEQRKYVIHTTANNLDGGIFFINQNEILEKTDFIKNMV